MLIQWDYLSYNDVGRVLMSVLVPYGGAGALRYNAFKWGRFLTAPDTDYTEESKGSITFAPVTPPASPIYSPE